MKVQRISYSTFEINFLLLREEFTQYWESFLLSEIGHIHVAVPWDDLLKTAQDLMIFSQTN